MSTWVKVCAWDDLVPDRGAAALVEGSQVALFRLSGEDGVHAIAHRDPFSEANVMARGLVGSVGDVPVVASPMHKQRFALGTGECLDAPDIRVPVWQTRVIDGTVEVLVEPAMVVQ